ncbi:hypothetical protein KS4_07150 [Poriferisphaera corsica]|uniref:Uncharacterized protein n=1 Tax=Poriferisphaera corsica TaxID=2528020 RepID=A0A517YR67_9BACT|nr:hypothetical protein KS4_07150 [Poriferisphaera corsica]
MIFFSAKKLLAVENDKYWGVKIGEVFVLSLLYFVIYGEYSVEMSKYFDSKCEAKIQQLLRINKQ